MEIIIFIAVVVVAALLWSGYVKAKKTDSDNAIDSWIPGGPGKDPSKHPLAQFNTGADKPWPYGEKLPEGKIHVKVADVAPVTSDSNEDRVEAPAPVAEPVPAKKPAAKKTAAKPAAAKKPAVKKAPAKKSST